ncbi:unnamed protein product, partial [Mesorhabditis belari]|uniref:Paired domain-containing protein n=1 Tax=Mesorhabditis belari TaxID=2138241 RepID=A0AAF3JBL8_9BILA
MQTRKSTRLEENESGQRAGEQDLRLKERSKEDNKQDAQHTTMEMAFGEDTIDSDGVTHKAEANSLVQVSADNSIQIDAETRGEDGNVRKDDDERHKLSNSLQLNIAGTTVKEEQDGNVLQKKENDGGNQLDVGYTAQVDVKPVNTPRNQRYMRRASKDENVAAKELELIRKTMVKKKIKKEALTQTEKGKDGLTSSNLQLNDSLNDQQLTNPAVKKARQGLLTRFTVRQLREFICISHNLPRPYQSNGSAPVRRQQRERREMLRVAIVPAFQHQSTADFKLTFPFLTMQVGDYHGSLPFGMVVHPQQQGRMNSLTLNGQSKRLIYEFTLLDNNNNLGYAVWTLALSNIVAIYVFDHLVCMKLNVSPMQVVSFAGNKSNLSYDLTNGQRACSPFHYFQLNGPAQNFFDGLVKCDANHFAAILLSEEEFFEDAIKAKGESNNNQEEHYLHERKPYGLMMNSNGGGQLNSDEGGIEARYDSYNMTQENFLHGKKPYDVVMNSNSSDQSNSVETPRRSKMVSPIMATESPSYQELLHYAALGHSKSFENAQSQNIDMDLDISSILIKWMDEGKDGNELIALTSRVKEEERRSNGCIRGVNCRGWIDCRCLIDISTPATLERDFNAWLRGMSPSSSSSGTEYSTEISTEYSTDSSMRSEYSAEYGTIEGCYLEYSLGYSNFHEHEFQADNLIKMETTMLDYEKESKMGQQSVNREMNAKPEDGRKARRKGGGTNLYGRPYCPGRPLSMLERTQIIELHLAGMKVNAISKTLCISHGCVSKIISRYRTTGILSPASSPEQRKLSDSINHQIAMLVKEYRILLPFNVDDFKRGHLYTTAETSKAETGGGEGVEILKQEEFESDDLRPGEHLEGIYTYKIYRIKSKVPWLLQKMLPESAFILHEESWNAYPYFKTVVTNPGYMKKGFKIQLESYHIQDKGDAENPLNAKKKCEVVAVDIIDEKSLKKVDLEAKINPRMVRSEKMEIGPLKDGWTEDEDIPVMCAYKLVSVTFSWRGIGGQIEKLIHKNYPRLFNKFHREVYCRSDEWWDMDMDEIRDYEEKTAKKLRKMINNNQKRGVYRAASDSERLK